ncbi:MAG: helix-turn-helix transcriptional regulator [candidate division WOR-3 bacterium]
MSIMASVIVLITSWLIDYVNLQSINLAITVVIRLMMVVMTWVMVGSAQHSMSQVAMVLGFEAISLLTWCRLISNIALTAMDNGISIALGQRLRQLRLAALLTQDQVAERMGLTGPGRRALIHRLETGRTSAPGLFVIARFLRACGARWYQITDILEQAWDLPPDTSALCTSELAPEAQVLLRERVTRQAEAYERTLRHAEQGRVYSPEQQQVMASRQRSYRLVVEVVEEAVRARLQRAGLARSWHALYHSVALQVTGWLWQEAKSSAKRKTLLTQESGLPEHLRPRLEAWRGRWQRQELDPALTAKVQTLAVHTVLNLLRRHPDLFPLDPRPNCPS